MNKFKILSIIFFLATLFPATRALAQTETAAKRTNYLDLNWKEVATKMPATWYGTPEAKLVAETVLLAQKDIGGWSKNKPYHLPLSAADKDKLLKDKKEIGATFDNGATITEMAFMSKMYSQVKDELYRKAFEKGLDYIFLAQYPNGGWPQFYPVRKGNSVNYSAHITFNDNAIVNIMQFLKAIYTDKAGYEHLKLSLPYQQKAQNAFAKGIDCILKTQIKVNGQPTVWCAQHDAVTLAPANARAYELASFSGAESVGITMLLMEMQNPSQEIINAVKGAVKWFEKHKLEGLKISTVVNAEGKKDRVVVPDKSAPPLWARFYDLETGQPYFADRDGIKVKTFAELGYERRNGYMWYTDGSAKVLQEYPAWAKKWGVATN